MNTPTGPDDSTQVLTSLRAHRAVRDRAEIAILNDVLDWCVIHQTDDEGEASFGDHGIPLAGDGAPWVSEFAVMELGTAFAVSTDSAKRYVGATLEVRYRLPKIWERVVDPEGINHEMRPWMTMTMPRGVAGLTVETVPLGRPLGRAWLRLFGVVPFDFDRLSIVELRLRCPAQIHREC